MRTRCCLVFLLLAAAAIAAPPIPVILDTDIGDDIDDALALSLALQSPELDVRAVCTSWHLGQKRADLTWKILKLFNRTDIPVGIGSEVAMVAEKNGATVRQADALGGTEAAPDAARQNGIELTIKTILGHPGKITWLAYGPATNLGIILRAEPKVREKIERIVLMNGVFFRNGVEYNTRCDPEASHIVYSSGIPVVAVGLDVTMQCRLSMDDLARIASSPMPTVRFLDKIIKIWQNGNPEARPVLHDPLSIAVTFDPSLVKLTRGRVIVDLRGDPRLTYGMTLFREDKAGTVEVAREVDSARFVNLFMQRVTAPPRGR